MDAVEREPRAFTFAELASLGSARSARTLIAHGALVRLLSNAYVASIHADSFAARADAALLWGGPRASLSGLAAMFVWGMLETPPGQVEIIHPHPTHLHPPPWLRIRRATYTPDTMRVNRLTVVGPHHAMVYGYGRLPRSERAEVLYRAVRSRRTDPSSLGEVLERVPRCPARGELKRRIEAAALGAESYLEERSFVSVFAGAEFARLIRQHGVRTNGRRYRLDLYDPATRTAIELGGDAFHAGEENRIRDVRRDADLATVGIQTVRFSRADLIDRPEWCREILRGVLRARSDRQ